MTAPTTSSSAPSLRTLTLGHSPDPDDAFMFWALANDRIDTGGLAFEHVLQDIQTLNERATRGELDITAISIHAYADPRIHTRYAVLSSGASMGDNYGPMIVTRDAVAPERLHEVEIAVPGLLTSAFLALRLWFAERGIRSFRHRVVPFDAIMEEVVAGTAEAGLLIHEGQLVYEKAGLLSPLNLGKWWFERTGGLPLPLGCNAVRKELGAPLMRQLARVLRESIRVSLASREEALRHALRWARGMDVPLADEFVGMYVNDLTLDYGDRGREAIRRFLGDAHAAGLIAAPVAVEFVTP